ncbi:hypothetical protein UXO42_07935 [Enterobacter quasihormaechei]|uniref:hypothetical protein n=1 Tax=Enterobacter quasihormaechei TaxID=2529382 RepID=UPI002FD0B1CC
MNKKLSVLFFTVGLYSSQSLAQGVFSGQWSGEEKNKSTLTLNLKQTGQEIQGNYCYITQGGNRIDCPLDNEINLKGRVANNNANIEFNSSFGGEKGRATLAVNGNEMMWSLITPPGKGEYYAPVRYSLHKEMQKNKPEKRKLSTDKFMITIVNKCGGFNIGCDDMYYLGVRKSDNSTISLNGKSLYGSNGEVTGSIFENDGVTYTVNYSPLKLVVRKGQTILIEQSGQWIK